MTAYGLMGWRKFQPNRVYYSWILPDWEFSRTESEMDQLKIFQLIRNQRMAMPDIQYAVMNHWNCHMQT
jgi:hypothetical protein